MITPIESIAPILSVQGDEEKVVSTGGVQNPFGAVFQSAIENVKETDAKKVEAQYLLATGQLDNPASLVIASTKNQLAVDMLVQLRNKSLEAYSELTRINM